nr:precorrin-6y C5,15-methyltransferase (decarboxylating) subunit CbiE [Actinomycetota bacterium]
MSRISVIGLDGGPLSATAASLLEGAALVVGGARHLAALGVEPQRTAILKGDLSEAHSRIEKTEGPVVVLASGDPGFFGIARALGERFGTEDLRIIPAVSSVALAFARAGLSWDDAVTVSAHGRDPRRAVNVCRSRPKVAVLTSPEFGPAELARELGDTGRTFLVAERLGEPAERVYRGGAGEVSGMDWKEPNVVLVLDEERKVGRKGSISASLESVGRWALPEDEFEHSSGMITKPETRALVLARLG